VDWWWWLRTESRIDLWNLQFLPKDSGTKKKALTTFSEKKIVSPLLAVDVLYLSVRLRKNLGSIAIFLHVRREREL